MAEGASLPAGLLLALVLVLCSAACLVLWRWGGSVAAKTPPGVLGLPLRGSVHDFIASCHSKVSNLRAKKLRK